MPHSHNLTIGITGGAGFLGTALARELSRNYHIKLLDVKEPKEIPPSVEFMKCDVRVYDEVVRAFKDVDVVIHAAIIQIPAINHHKRLGYEVNFIGTHNVCKAVDELERPKGLVLAGSWHVIGERELKGVIDEEFGFRPDKVEERAKLYVLSKIAQEVIVRYFDELSEKRFIVIRMGTILGEGMPEKTAANIFISKGLKGEPITPFKHSMYRPMLYVDVHDVVKGYSSIVRKILEEMDYSWKGIVNLFYPEPITILELAEIVRDTIIELTKGGITPKIEIVDKGLPEMFSPDDKYKFSVNITKSLKLLGIDKLTPPRESIRRIVMARLKKMGYTLP